MTSSLLVVAALHVGFQAVVSVVVYPALAEVKQAGWPAAHAAHSRRIAVLVVPLYLGILVACGAVLVEEPLSPALGLALAGQGFALLVTAVLAAPLHGVLGRRGPEPELLRRLLVVDRLRLLGASVGLVGAVLVSFAA